METTLDPVNPGTIKVTVEDSGGAALPNKPVTATPSLNGGTATIGHTNANGVANLSVAPGAYSVTVGGAVTVASDQTIEFKVVIK